MEKDTFTLHVPGFVPVKDSPCSNDPDLFFSESSSKIELAKALCQGCPFKEICLRQATEDNEVGVWGGEFFPFEKGPSGPAVTFCRKGLHVMVPGSGRCAPCRRESQREYNKTPKRAEYKRALNRKVKDKKRNKIGGSCRNGHLLTESNTDIRKYDGALMCLTCLQGKQKTRFKTDRGERISGKAANPFK